MNVLQSKYCVSSIYIALGYIPGVSGDHSKSEGCPKATPPPIAEGADQWRFGLHVIFVGNPRVGGTTVAIVHAKFLTDEESTG